MHKYGYYFISNRKRAGRFSGSFGLLVKYWLISNKCDLLLAPQDRPAEFRPIIDLVLHILQGTI